VADIQRTARRYQRAAKAVEATAAACLCAMAIVLLLGSGPWVGGVAMVLLLAAAGVYVSAWPLQRRSAETRWRAVQARWAGAQARALRAYADRWHGTTEGIRQAVDYGTGVEYDAVCACGCTVDEDRACTERRKLLADATAIEAGREPISVGEQADTIGGAVR